MSIVMGKALAVAICQQLGVDSKRVVNVCINSPKDGVASVSIEVLIDQGFLSAVDALIGEKATK